MALDKEGQVKLIDEITSKKDKKILDFDKYKDIEKFNLYNFLEELDEIIQKNNPTIYVYVGNVNYNYDYIDSKIKTELYKNMIEGIIIKYQNIVYDYSI